MLFVTEPPGESRSRLAKVHDQQRQASEYRETKEACGGELENLRI